MANNNMNHCDPVEVIPTNCEKDETASSTPHTFSDTPTLNMLREKQLGFITERNWDPFQQPRNVLLALVGEIGELAELFQWKGECKEGLPDWQLRSGII